MTPLLLSGLTGRLTAEFETLRAWADAASEDHMSVVGMFMAADVIVKGVMLSLAFASVLVWAIFAARVALLMLSKQRLKSNYRALEAAGALGAAETRFAKGSGVVGAMVRAAIREHGASFEGGPSGVKTRTDSALSRIEAGAARNMQRGSGVLAIVGSSAPFVGLFGTVWGIMNSFISIAETNTTNLAVVAPGIAEALLATAIGLVAAIPAVIFYNLLAKMNGGYRGMLADASALVSRTLSRDLDLGRDVTAPAPAEAPAPAPVDAAFEDSETVTAEPATHANADHKTDANADHKTDTKAEADADTGLKTPLPAE